MLKMTDVLVAYRDEDDGAALAEYSVTFLVIVVAGVVGLAAMGTNLSDAFSGIAIWIQTNITTPLAPLSFGINWVLERRFRREVQDQATLW